MRACLFAILSLLVASCSGPSTPGAASPQMPSAPVPTPGPGISGCVESRELKGFVLALDSHRQASRQAALAGLGASPAERRGVFAEPGEKRLGDTYESGGKRYGVIAHMAPHFEPVVAVAQVGSRLRRIDERPSAHPVPIIACGVNACPAARGASVAARPVAIELAEGEELGDALAVSYEFWFARVSYDRRRECPMASTGHGGDAPPPAR
jgi:hypothetical protein